MEINALTKVNQDFIKRQIEKKSQPNSVANTTNPIDTKENPKTEPKENKEENKGNGKKLLLALGGLAAAGAAAYLLLKKGKAINLEQFKESGYFDLGKAFFKGKPFSGKITVGADDAQKVITYEKGKMVSALANGVLKKYNYDEADKLVSVDKFSKAKELIESINLKDIKVKVLQDKAKLADLFDNQEKYTHGGFLHEILNNVQYKSKNDIKKVNEVLAHKTEIDLIIGKRAKRSRVAELKALDAQALYNKPFEEKLTHKSAEESANVFKKVFGEISARENSEKDIENARKAQDALIQVMQNPSGKKAESSAKVFIKKLPDSAK